MNRFLSTMQGLVSMIFVVVSAIFGWPIWLTILGLLVPMLLSFVIFSSREESPKGRTREIVELAFGLVLGVGGLLYWAFSSETRLSLSQATPLWMAIAALPSVLFNLGVAFAWVCWILGTLFGYLQEFFEWISGETVRGAK
ncbi:MAG TPA: hypothetical protein VN174_03080 [Candidatus Methanoperedens sp.]|nr:hypothetical protein [Candidatus Methanoperedens sp.]